jgi:uroporphyrinogen decarboxylase
MAPDPRSERFLRACRREPVDTTPIWMMRQAGRSLPAYREFRRKYSFKQVAGTPELCAEVTLMPLAEMPVDAAIIFADIMTPMACLGIDYEIVEGVGPRVADPIRTTAQVERLASIPPEEALPELFDAMRLVVERLGGEVPMIGFAGAPFTLASYLVEGRPDAALPATRALMKDHPAVWHGLLDRMSSILVDYLGQQVKAGVQAVQLFDSWVGRLTHGEYTEFALPYSARIFEQTSGLGVPRIHFGTGTKDLLELMASPGPEVVGVDASVPLDDAWDRVGHDKAVQGNLNPQTLLGSPEQVVAEAEEVLRRAAGRPGHVFNLGHGVLPDTPLDNLKLLVDTVHGYPLR